MKLDHVVHYVEKPAKEAAGLFQLLGFHTIAGGIHDKWGSSNSLCYFDLSYLEFLTIDDRKKALQSDNPLIQLVGNQKNEGLYQVALRTNEMNSLVERFKQKGLNVMGPFPGQRKRADGKLLEWKMLFVSHQEASYPLPFFIEWKDSDEERRRDLEEIGAILPHPNKYTHIYEVGYAVKQPTLALKQWKEWFGIDGEEYVDESFIHGKGVRLLLDDVFITFLTPKGDSEFSYTNEGPLYVSLTERFQSKVKEIMGGYYIL
ncbi:VOC family protein [Metabacillus arenae]|uniref:VOC family protein n=1 Tax=Metabacillus arenae TaxID=2771434 RepID=A0A926S2N4_9BACI|nr:VOC family protein [Metabacillus arenae]MBD1382174.1 VOC family protein [Metabacillus arenae]